MLDPRESIGAISTILGEAFNTVISEVSNPSKIPVDKLMQATESDPVAYACCQIKQARAMQLMDGKYKHPNSKIDKFINHNLDNLQGNIPELVGRLSSAMAYGFSCAEPVYKSYPLAWKLQKFHILNPSKIKFKIVNGDSPSIKYDDGGRDKNIPLNKLVHVTNGLFSNFGYKYLYGNPESLRAYPFIRLKQLLFGEMGVTSKRLATGLLVGKANSNDKVIVKDENGNIIKNAFGQPLERSAVDNLARQLARIENNSYLVTDKENDIIPMQIPGGEQFWGLAQMMIDTQIMRSFVIPDTIFQQGVASFGVGSLAAMQLNILDSSVQELVKQIKEKLIEKVVRNLIIWNFGIQSDYGEFVSNESVDPQKEAQTLNSLMGSMSMGLVPNDDPEAINKLRNLLGLSQLDEGTMKLQEQLKMQMMQLQQQAAQSQTQEQAQPEAA